MNPFVVMGLFPFVFATAPAARSAPMGDVAPRKSADTAPSPRGVQAGDNERVTLFERGGDGRCARVEFVARPQLTVRDQGQFAGVGDMGDAYPSVPLVAGDPTTGGAALIAYWPPWQPREYTPRPARVSLRAAGLTFTEPVLVNRLDGAVHALPRPKVDHGDSVFENVPMFDFPLVIAERTETIIGKTRSTPAHEAIPQL